MFLRSFTFYCLPLLFIIYLFKYFLTFLIIVTVLLSSNLWTNYNYKLKTLIIRTVQHYDYKIAPRNRLVYRLNIRLLMFIAVAVTVSPYPPLRFVEWAAIYTHVPFSYCCLVHVHVKFNFIISMQLFTLLHSFSFSIVLFLFILLFFFFLHRFLWDLKEYRKRNRDGMCWL